MTRSLQATPDQAVVAGIADTHGGHKLALCNPATVLVRQDKKGNVLEHTPELTDVQVELWAQYLADIAQVQGIAGRRPIYLFHDGDATWGTKYPAGLMEIEPPEQVTIAAYNLRPWYPQARATRLIHGTAAHVLLGDYVSSEVQTAAMLRGWYPKTDTAAYYHERIAVKGVIFDVAHHGPAESQRSWLAGNTARYYLRDRMWRDVAMGKQPARVYLRAHFHTLVHEQLSERIGGQEYTSDLVILPSYCSMTYHARKATQSLPELVSGLCLFEIAKGELVKVWKLVHHTDLRMEEQLG